MVESEFNLCNAEEVLLEDVELILEASNYLQLPLDLKQGKSSEPCSPATSKGPTYFPSIGVMIINDKKTGLIHLFVALCLCSYIQHEIPNFYSHVALNKVIVILSFLHTKAAN